MAVIVVTSIDHHSPKVPLWIRRPRSLHIVAYVLAALVFTGQLLALGLTGADLPTGLSVMLAGAGVTLSWWKPWAGLVIASAASLAVTAVGRDPLSVWMLAVLVLFSITLKGERPVVGIAVVAACFLGAFMTIGGFRGGAIVGTAALFSAIAGGATGGALHVHTEHWWALEERAARAVATRELEATRRVAEERLRIARDLHDVIGHQVAMLSLHLGAAELGLPKDAESAHRALVAARASARTVVVETQRIVVLLRRGDDDDDVLRPTPTMDRLHGLIASFEGIGLEIDTSIDLPTGAVEPSVGVTIYRVVQEALTNAQRHGQGSVSVDVRVSSGNLCVTVENRVGANRSDPREGSGLGLVGMRERVESLGGRLRAGGDGERFIVRAELGPAGRGAR